MDREPFVVCVQVLNALLKADDQITDEEHGYLNRVMDDMELNDTERQRAQQPLDDKARREAVEALPRALMTGLLQSLIKGALVDGHVDTRERAFIQRLAQDIGVDDYTIAYLWDRVTDPVDGAFEDL